MANLWFAPVIQIQRDCGGQKVEVSEVAPLAEKSINRWTAATIRSSIKMAANGFSASMYVKSEGMSWRQAAKHYNMSRDSISKMLFNPQARAARHTLPVREGTEP